MKTQELIEKIVREEIYTNQSFLVEELLKNEIVSIEEIENLFDEEDEIQEVLEWWVVSKWFADKLREKGEPILDTDFEIWWGRTCSGQSITLDSVIKKIAESIQS